MLCKHVEANPEIVLETGKEAKDCVKETIRLTHTDRKIGG